MSFSCPNSIFSTLCLITELLRHLEALEENFSPFPSLTGSLLTPEMCCSQWLYGHTALRRCLGTLRIFQDPANRVPIEIELTKASENEEEIWKDTEGRKEPEDEVHFPFVMTCLILGASIGVEDGYYHHVLVEPFNMAYDEGDNNNGITIFDISDPTKVRYCFVDYNGMESNREVQLMSPLSARTYLDAYYKLDESEGAQFLSLVDKFAKCPLIVRIIPIFASLITLSLYKQALAQAIYIIVFSFILPICINMCSQVILRSIFQCRRYHSETP